MSRKTVFFVGTGYLIASLITLVGLLALTSCGGGGGDSGGPEHDYTVRLSPDKTTVAPGGTVNLNLYYDAPSNNAGINWGIGCIQGDCGSVSAAAVYTAPAKVDEQMVVGIRAMSKDDPTKSYYVEIWVTGKIVVRINANNLIGLHVSQTAQLTAAVNSPDTGLIWQVNGVTGGNSTVGTISTTGLYTAPAQVPSPDVVNVGAVAHVDSSASATVPVTIWPAIPVTVSVSPQDQSVPVGTTIQFTATVENTADKAVQWQVNGIEGGNSTLGTISAAGLFTAPAAIPSPAKETITAVSHADTTKSASTSVTIVALHNDLLNGSYAFELSGPDASGKMMAMIGSVAADGNGNLHGLLDINGVAMTAAQTSVQFTGTYRIGGQNMGYMYLNLTPQLTVAFTIDDAGTNAKLIEFDTRGTRYVGSLQKQETPLSLDKLMGYYVFSCFGSTMSGERITSIGRFQSLGGAGTILNGMVYTKEQGEDLAVAPGVTAASAMTNNTYGRGDFGFVKAGVLLAHFSFYMTSGNDVYFMSTDAVPSDKPLLVGRILKQAAGPFSYASLWHGSVFSAAGVMATDSSKSVVVAGQWQADPNANALSGTQDINKGGQILANQYLYSTYVIDVTGYGTLLNFMFYIVDQNRAMLMSGDEEGLIGMAEPQAQISCDSSLLDGTYRIGPISMPVPGGSISQGLFVADGAGTFWAGENILDQGATTQILNGNYTVDSTGRTEVTVTSPEAFHYVMYPASGSRFVGISIEPNDSKPNLAALDK